MIAIAGEPRFVPVGPDPPALVGAQQRGLEGLPVVGGQLRSPLRPQRQSDEFGAGTAKVDEGAVYVGGVVGSVDGGGDDRDGDVGGGRAGDGLTGGEVGDGSVGDGVTGGEVGGVGVEAASTTEAAATEAAAARPAAVTEA